jgi:hypothetical protein
MFGDAERWGDFGRCFLLSRFLVISSVIFFELFHPQAATCIVNRSVVISVLSVFGLAVYVTLFQADVLSFETVLKYVGLRQGVYWNDLIATTLYFSALEEISAVLRGRVNIRKLLEELCADLDNDDENRNADDVENRNPPEEDIRHGNDDENMLANDRNGYANNEDFTFAYLRRTIVLCLLAQWYCDILRVLHTMPHGMR